MGLPVGLADLATEARAVLRAPICLVTLSDELFARKASRGLASAGVHLNHSFHEYAAAPHAPDLIVVGDTLDDVRFVHDAMIVGQPFVRFCAAAALRVGSKRIGSICMMDTAPRESNISALEAELLMTMAAAVVDQLRTTSWSLYGETQGQKHEGPMPMADSLFHDLDSTFDLVALLHLDCNLPSRIYSSASHLEALGINDLGYGDRAPLLCLPASVDVSAHDNDTVAEVHEYNVWEPQNMKHMPVKDSSGMSPKLFRRLVADSERAGELGRELLEMVWVIGDGEGTCAVRLSQLPAMLMAIDPPPDTVRLDAHFNIPKGVGLVSIGSELVKRIRCGGFKGGLVIMSSTASSLFELHYPAYNAKVACVKGLLTRDRKPPLVTLALKECVRTCGREDELSLSSGGRTRLSDTSTEAAVLNADSDFNASFAPMLNNTHLLFKGSHEAVCQQGSSEGSKRTPRSFQVIMPGATNSQAGLSERENTSLMAGCMTSDIIMRAMDSQSLPSHNGTKGFSEAPHLKRSASGDNIEQQGHHTPKTRSPATSPRICSRWGMQRGRCHF